MGEVLLSFVGWLERRDPPWLTVSSVFAASIALASRVFYLLGKIAGREEILDWLAKNPFAGYQLREQRQMQRRRDPAAPAGD